MCREAAPSAGETDKKMNRIVGCGCQDIVGTRQ